MAQPLPDDLQLLTALYEACIKDSIFSIEATIDLFNALTPLLAAASYRSEAQIEANVATAGAYEAQLHLDLVQLLRRIRHTSPSPTIPLHFLNTTSTPNDVNEAINHYTKLIREMQVLPSSLQISADIKAANDLRKYLIGKRIGLEEKEEEAKTAAEKRKKKRAQRRPRTALLDIQGRPIRDANGKVMTIRKRNRHRKVVELPMR